MSLRLLFRLGGLLFDFFDSLFEGLEGIDCECDFFALDFSGFEDEISHFPKITFDVLAITKAVSAPSAPQTDVRFEASANSVTDSAVGTGIVSALPPLVVEFGVFGFGYDVFALGFS